MQHDRRALIIGTTADAICHVTVRLDLPHGFGNRGTYHRRVPRDKRVLERTLERKRGGRD